MTDVKYWPYLNLLPPETIAAVDPRLFSYLPSDPVPYYFTRCAGDALFRIVRSRFDDAGGATFPSRTISRALNSFP